jgi:hypothetical protein
MFRIVLDHPHRHLGRRLWRRVTTLVGGVLLMVGLTASVPALPSTFAVGTLGMAWATAEETDPDPLADIPVREIVLVWAVTAPVAIIGMRSGLRLLRRNRSLILFLRRFGYDDAQSAITYAVLQTIGGSWRVVTLDDAEMVPIGVADGTRRVFSAGRVASKSIISIGHFLGLGAFPYLTGTLWAIVALALAGPALEFAQTGVPRWDKWGDTIDPYIRIASSIFDGRPPLEAVAPTLPGVFAVVAMAAAASFGVLIVTMVVLLVAVPMSGVLAFVSTSDDSVQEAERLKTMAVSSLSEIRAAAAGIARRSRKVFGPRLVVIKVASQVWREAVSELASVSALPLIDISEPTDNVLWELQELLRRFGDRCVIIGRHERVIALAAVPQGQGPASIDDRLVEMIGDRDVLVYTTDRSGLKRFARALRGVLLTRQR